MADDDLDEEFDAEAVEDDLDEDVIDEDVIDEDVIGEVGEDDEVADVVDIDAEVDADEEESAEEVSARLKKRRDDDEDDDDELDPDDVEADLDTILKDRIAAVDEEEDDDELEVAPRAAAESPDGVIPKKANEFMCTGCFLLVNRNQFGPLNAMECPVGESECPAINQIRAEAAPRPAKAKRR